MAEELKVNLIDHPLIQHKLTIMRQKATGHKDFRILLEEISMLMTYEISRDFELKSVDIETPVDKCTMKMLADENVCIVPILRAGLGMLNGVLEMIPTARVGHIGLYRDPKTLQPVEYYCKMPPDISERQVFIVDPMLATGGSASAAISILKEKYGCKYITLMDIIASPEGVAVIRRDHPDVDMFVCSVDERLNENAYIIPGLGDAGDRIFGTK